MAESTQSQSTNEKTYLVEVTDEDLHKLQQSGVQVQALRRALIRVTEEVLQKLQLSAARVEAAATESHHDHDHASIFLEAQQEARRQTSSG